MQLVHQLFEGGGLLGQKLKGQAILLGRFEAACPTVDGGDWTVDLHTGRPALHNRGLGDAGGVGSLADGGPRDEHGSGFAGVRGSRKRESHDKLSRLVFNPQAPTVERVDAIKDFKSPKVSARGGAMWCNRWRVGPA